MTLFWAWLKKFSSVIVYEIKQSLNTSSKCKFEKTQYYNNTYFAFYVKVWFNNCSSNKSNLKNGFCFLVSAPSFFLFKLRISQVWWNNLNRTIWVFKVKQKKWLIQYQQYIFAKLFYEWHFVWKKGFTNTFVSLLLDLVKSGQYGSDSETLDSVSTLTKNGSGSHSVEMINSTQSVTSTYVST